MSTITNMRNMRTDVHRAWLREMRLSKGYTMLELAQKMGVSTNYIGDMEHGRRNPAPTLAMKLAAEFQFPLERLYVDAIPRSETERVGKTNQ